MTDEADAPDVDEVEISVFGAGYGEAICVHHQGDWFLVDSCIHPPSREAAALAYLTSLNVPLERVRLLVISHWDDDHTQGVSEIVERCDSATVACSLSLNRNDIVQFVIQQESLEGGVGSGVDEIRDVLQKCRGTERFTWAKSNTALHPRTPGVAPIVTALSPSDDSVSRSIESLIERAETARISYRRRYRAPDRANEASVASLVCVDGTAVLLGADLENTDNPLAGWTAVLESARPALASSIVKVPHHGSDDAFSLRVWDEIVDKTAIAILTPWTLGGGFLPTEEDVARVKNVAGTVYLTAMPTLGRVKKDPRIEKLITKVANIRIETITGWGHVRARRKPGDDRWRVDTNGDAVLIG